jgi:hypothetical protein
MCKLGGEDIAVDIDWAPNLGRTSDLIAIAYENSNAIIYQVLESSILSLLRKNPRCHMPLRHFM